MAVVVGRPTCVEPSKGKPEKAVETDQYLTALARESKALAEAAAAAGPSAAVPSCPGWTVSDLLVHCASGDYWARSIIEQKTTERVPTELPEDPPTGDALAPWFLAGAHALIDALSAADPSTPVWTFSPADRTARFWFRRRAHETSIHRYDAQLAAGMMAEVIDAPLAADGVDEFLTFFVPRWGKDAVGTGETLHFHCTDVDGEWLLVGSEDGVTVTREHAKGDVAARGSASDLMLFVWGRVPASQVEAFGDEDLLHRFAAAINV
jgi:uncharacterized protein (TIGR03083 family)